MAQKLTNKPLVEALIELKWELQAGVGGTFKDPAYPFFIGKYFDLLKNDYPNLEELPAIQIPDEMTPHVVKYRFRKTKFGWPLVQAGPGIVTLNFDVNYDWDNFLETAQAFHKCFLEAYCFDGRDAPKLTSCTLRFLNGIEVGDADSIDFISFIASNLHTKITLPKKISDLSQVNDNASAINLNVQFPLSEPEGSGVISLSNGKNQDKDGIILQLAVHSEKLDNEEAAFENWLTGAHAVIEKWFLTLISGNLKKQFMEEKK